MKLTPEMKKGIIFAIPLVLLFYVADKVAALFRLAAGDFTAKLLYTFMNINHLFDNPLPSFHPADLLFGLAVAGAVLGVVYSKRKNAKKFRQDVEYGSARWGTKADIQPFMDADPANNIILTQTEGLMMSSRPKSPKYARNKNVLVIGGSGSGENPPALAGKLCACGSPS